MVSSPARPEVKIDWFIPIDGDGARAGTRQAERPPTFDYLSQVARTAEELGFYSLLIPTRSGRRFRFRWKVAPGRACGFERRRPQPPTPSGNLDHGHCSSRMVTQRIRFLVAVPGRVLYQAALGLFAQMAGALHQISGGRLDILPGNIVPGGIQGDFERTTSPKRTSREVSDHATRSDPNVAHAPCEPKRVTLHPQEALLQQARAFQHRCLPAAGTPVARTRSGFLSGRVLPIRRRVLLAVSRVRRLFKTGILGYSSFSG